MMNHIKSQILVEYINMSTLRTRCSSTTVAQSDINCPSRSSASPASYVKKVTNQNISTLNHGKTTHSCKVLGTMSHSLISNLQAVFVGRVEMTFHTSLKMASYPDGES